MVSTLKPTEEMQSRSWIHVSNLLKKLELSAANKNDVQGILPLMLQSLNDSKVLPERYEKAKCSLMHDTNIVILSADKGGKLQL